MPIWEERKYTKKDLRHATAEQRAEIMADMMAARREKRKHSPMKERNQHIQRLSMSGLETQLQLQEFS